MSAEATNAFGLWGFGDLPEVCADRWAPTYEGAPTDGSPRRGDGPRVCRGGAGQVFPWQRSGEWALLLTTSRASAEAWEYAVGVRPVIGLSG